MRTHCRRCGQYENVDDLGQGLCEKCEECALCCRCGTFDEDSQWKPTEKNTNKIKVTP